MLMYRASLMKLCIEYVIHMFLFCFCFKFNSLKNIVLCIVICGDDNFRVMFLSMTISLDDSSIVEKKNEKISSGIISSCSYSCVRNG